MDTFCGTRESELDKAFIAQWPDGDVTWALVGLPPRVTEDELRNAVTFGMAKWAKVCKVQPREVTSARSARVLVTARSIDGPGSILAECELPGGQAQVRLWLDTNEEWSTQIPAVRAIIMADVLWHELGHALGIGHAPQGSANIMAPIYNPAVMVPGPWDIEQAQERYGRPDVVPTPPVPQPTPVPPAPTPGGFDMGSFFMNLILNALKSWLAKAIADGTLQKFIEDLLKKFQSGQITTVEQLSDAMEGAATTANLMAP
jgi:hypothetical protein